MEEKRIQIMDAAAECFAKNGYKKTSITDIITKAGIAKGLVFYYFKNKKDLYMRTYKYYVEETKKILEGDLSKEPDFFKRIGMSISAKTDFIYQHKFAYEFLVSVYIEEDLSVVEDIAKYNEEAINDNTKLLYEGIDFSKFKSEFNITDVIKMVIWISDGIIKNSKTASVDEMMEEFKKYTQIMKKCFYKEEFINEHN